MSTAEIDTSSAAFYNHLLSGAERAKSAMEEIRRIVSEFDAKLQASEKATIFLSSAMDKVTASLAELSTMTHSIRGAADIPINAFSKKIAAANSAIVNLMEVARHYDEKNAFSLKISNVLAPHKKNLSTALVMVAGHASQVATQATAQLQGVSDKLRWGLLAAANTTLDCAIPTAISADERFGVTERSAVASTAVASQLKDLNERFGLSTYVGAAAERAHLLDQRFTGGKLSPTIVSAYQAGLDMIGQVSNAVQERYVEKKRELAESKSEHISSSSSHPPTTAVAVSEVVVESVPSVAQSSSSSPCMEEKIEVSKSQPVKVVASPVVVAEPEVAQTTAAPEVVIETPIAPEVASSKVEENTAVVEEIVANQEEETKIEETKAEDDVKETVNTAASPSEIIASASVPSSEASDELATSSQKTKKGKKNKNAGGR